MQKDGWSGCLDIKNGYTGKLTFKEKLRTPFRRLRNWWAFYKLRSWWNFFGKNETGE